MRQAADHAQQRRLAGPVPPCRNSISPPSTRKPTPANRRRSPRTHSRLRLQAWDFGGGGGRGAILKAQFWSQIDQNQKRCKHYCLLFILSRTNNLSMEQGGVQLMVGWDGARISAAPSIAVVRRRRASCRPPGGRRSHWPHDYSACAGVRRAPRRGWRQPPPRA